MKKIKLKIKKIQKIKEKTEEIKVKKTEVGREGGRKLYLDKKATVKVITYSNRVRYFKGTRSPRLLQLSPLSFLRQK